MRKKLLAMFLCIVMFVSQMPMIASAADYSDYTEICVVNLTGAKNLLTLGKVLSYDKAVAISDGGDKRFYVQNVKCKEAYDESYLYADGVLEPGVDYILEVYLYPNKGYTFPYDYEKKMIATMDGVSIDVKNMGTYTGSGMDNARAIELLIPFTVSGEKVEYLEKIEVTVTDKPIWGATPLKGTDACTVSNDAPYEIESADWRYPSSNGGWGPSKDFSESKYFELWVKLKPKEGKNIRLVDGKLTNVEIKGQSSFVSYRLSKNGYLYIRYDVESPKKYQVNYDPCGGAFPDGKTEVFTGGYTRPDGTVSHLWSDMRKTGYNFVGWYTDPLSGEKVTGTSTFSGPTTLYAHYEPCIDEVHIDSVMLPVAGQVPVFTAKIPDGSSYTIVSQRWTYEDDTNMLVASSSITENALL